MSPPPLPRLPRLRPVRVGYLCRCRRRPCHHLAICDTPRHEGRELEHLHAGCCDRRFVGRTDRTLPGVRSPRVRGESLEARDHGGLRRTRTRYTNERQLHRTVQQRDRFRELADGLLWQLRRIEVTRECRHQPLRVGEMLTRRDDEGLSEGWTIHLQHEYRLQRERRIRHQISQDSSILHHECRCAAGRSTVDHLSSLIRRQVS